MPRTLILDEKGPVRRTIAERPPFPKFKLSEAKLAHVHRLVTRSAGGYSHAEIQNMLKKSKENVRHFAALLSDSPALASFSSSNTEINRAVRAESCGCLLRAANDGVDIFPAFGALLYAMSDENVQVRIRSISALSTIISNNRENEARKKHLPRAFPYIGNAVYDVMPDVRLKAAYIFFCASIFTDVSSEVTAIMDALFDPVNKIREYAIKALINISSGQNNAYRMIAGMSLEFANSQAALAGGERNTDEFVNKVEALGQVLENLKREWARKLQKA